MAGSSSEDSGVGRALDRASNGQLRCQSSEALAEWRSSEQVENGVPSTSPPFWDTDEDDDSGPKPSELFGKYTWRIDKFSQITKKEVKSSHFEVGGYKWYILIYPQGCDVCNHISLFLCVANHDKLLPGWSHFAQFTIAVVNKDQKKSKYSDTLHRFWKKEHDWGWKKFMELSKIHDGFTDDNDTLVIKAQVQVIRERTDRPFRCLDCQYRRELVRVYLTNVEQICRRFVEERRGKLGKLIEDKARWSSFCAFWLGIDQNARRCMSKENTDSILKVVVKQFFIEKEVTSTLVMDSLYSGLKALEGQTKSKKALGKFLDAEDLPVPIVRIEKDAFILVDDVLLLIERAALEPLPPKDEKGPQNRTKEGGTGEDSTKDSIERDERRLTELGRRTIEIFVLAHIFSKIEVAYQEAVALKRQEELIREEEAAWMAETEKSKRIASEKEKKSKKKQGKNKRNNRKGKDKVRDGKPTEDKPEEKPQDKILTDGRKDLLIEDAKSMLVKNDTPEDISDVSDSLYCFTEALQPDSEERDSSPVNWDTDTSEFQPLAEVSSSGINPLPSVQNGERKSMSVMDDSSSTCSTDSLASFVMNGPSKGFSSNQTQKNQKSPTRGRSQRGDGSFEETGWVNGKHGQSSDSLLDEAQMNVARRCKVDASESNGVVQSLQGQVGKKEVVSLQRNLDIKDEVDTQRISKDNAVVVPFSPRSPSKNLPPAVQVKPDFKTSAAQGPVLARKQSSSDTSHRTDKAQPSTNSAECLVTMTPSTPKALSPKRTAEKPSGYQVSPASTENPKHNTEGAVTTRTPNTISQGAVATEKPSTQQVTVAMTTEKLTSQQVLAMSRPLSAPLIPGPKPTVAPVVSIAQSSPSLSRSVSAAGRLGPDTSVGAQPFVPQSYRNAMLGANPVSSSSTHSYSQAPPMMPFFQPQNSERTESSNSVRPSFSFGMVHSDVAQQGVPNWTETSSQRDSINTNTGYHYDSSSLLNDIQNINLYKLPVSRSQNHLSTEFPAGTSGRPTTHGLMADEFPHLDIINDLLNDELGAVSARCFGNGPLPLNRQLTYPGDLDRLLDQVPTSSGQFERMMSQHDELQRGYIHGSSQLQYDLSTDMFPQSNLLYGNGQIDGLISNQWQMGGVPDLSYLGMRNMARNMESAGYQYHHILDYPNHTGDANSYTMYRPSSGQ